MWKRSEPILPLTATWGEADFSLQSVVSRGQDSWAGSEARGDGGVDLRDWSIKLLSRYAYVFGQSVSVISSTFPAVSVLCSLGSRSFLSISLYSPDLAI